MDDAFTSPRTALLAGATGLVGRALLPLLLAGNHYRSVHVLLRRAVPDIEVSPKLQLHLIDFARLPAAFPATDDVFIMLGTTIKMAGSEAAFRQVDFEFVVNTAQAARTAGATRLAVVSALGADANSRIFYNRVKGEMEAAVAQLGYETVVTAQPSLLLGDRAALGQAVRSSEMWAARLLGPLSWMVPKAVRPIQARAVASALLTGVLTAKPGVSILKSAAMQGMTTPSYFPAQKCAPGSLCIVEATGRIFCTNAPGGRCGSATGAS